MSDTEKPAFEPAKYLVKIKGGDYLEVRSRILWFRTEHPEGVIETELMHHGDNQAVFRAKAAIPGGGSATGWGSEQIDDFRDYLEKAETKALGRALAALGYGTQFCFDYSDAEHGRIADAPIGARNDGPSGNQAPRGTSNDNPATPKQIKFLYVVAREAGWSDEDLTDNCLSKYDMMPEDLSKSQASAMIEKLQALKADNASRGATAPSKPASDPPKGSNTSDATGPTDYQIRRIYDEAHSAGMGGGAFEAFAIDLIKKPLDTMNMSEYALVWNAVQEFKNERKG